MDMVIDKELAIKRAGGRKELATELHAMLKTSIIELSEKIDQAWSEQNREDLLIHVHKLNGSTRYCGVPELEYRCEQMETLIKTDADASLDSAYERLLDAINHVLRCEIEF